MFTFLKESSSLFSPCLGVLLKQISHAFLVLNEVVEFLKEKMKNFNLVIAEELNKLLSDLLTDILEVLAHSLMSSDRFTKSKCCLLFV